MTASILTDYETANNYFDWEAVAVSLVGDAEKYLMRHKDALHSTLKQLLLQRNVKTVKQLSALHEISDVSVPCYVRVNTLKLDDDSALLEIGEKYSVQKDDLLPNLLILPPGTDLHDHPLVKNGSIFMQVGIILSLKNHFFTLKTQARRALRALK